eukprot:GFUD01076461.1.p1 GENE.GFUD01076461.1~~GFUD01076461.1.p1  ORF type:complete len:523 (+),score=152.86 GFUD01076461.1:49-1617(+)
MEKSKDNIIEELLFNFEVTSKDVISHDGPVFPNVFPDIDRKTAKWIDQQLDWEDAVSFAFLMVEKVDIALKLSRAIEQHQRNIFQDDGNEIGIVQVINLSAEKNSAISWQIRVYQALFLLEHKKMLYELGIDDEEAQQRFQGGNHIKAERRLLFKLCQDLEMKDQAMVGQLMKTQLGSVPPLLMMESLFLHLMSVRNTESLCNFVMDCLKDMNRADLVNTFSHDKCGKATCEIHMKQDDTDDEVYEQGAGLCVIINQKIFNAEASDPHAIKLDDRLGTDRDRDELEVTFTLFGAECLIYNDLTHRELQDKLEQAALKANNPKYFWVAVCVLSHGRRLNGVDEILGVNGIGMDRKKIISMFADASKCPNLQKKPKLFFFQACRGVENTATTCQEHIASDSAVHCVGGWPAISDYMVASATIEDFVSFRSTVEGSFFIRHLCKVFQEHGHEKTLADLMIIVNSKVAGHRQDFPSQPEYTSTMSKKFMFKRTRQSTVSGVEKMAKNGLFNLLQNQFIAERVSMAV